MNEVTLNETPEEQPQAEKPKAKAAPAEKAKKPAKDNVFFFKREEATRWLPFTLFVFVMVVFYISLQQYAERTVRNTEKLTREIKELRSEYLSTKAELMQESMQTDIAKKLEESGLKELREPAMKLKIEPKKAN
jgi:cell division protein FtsL